MLSQGDVYHDKSYHLPPLEYASLPVKGELEVNSPQSLAALAWPASFVVAAGTDASAISPLHGCAATLFRLPPPPSKGSRTMVQCGSSWIDASAITKSAAYSRFFGKESFSGKMEMLWAVTCIHGASWLIVAGVHGEAGSRFFVARQEAGGAVNLNEVNNG